MDILGLVITTAVLSIIAVAIGYFAFLKTRPKKMTWKAEVFQLGEGIKPFKRDKDGNILSKVKLSELKPYTKDIIERTEEAHGIIVFRLAKLNKVTAPITQDVVDYWGDQDKRVSVVMIDGTPAILKKGYDRTCGEIIFDPVPHDKMNMVTSEISIRKSRKKEKKDILEAISPWVVTCILMITVFAIAYLSFDTMEKVSDNLRIAEEKFASNQLKIAEIYEKVENGKRFVIPTNSLGVQSDNTNSSAPPTITG